MAKKLSKNIQRIKIILKLAFQMATLQFQQDVENKKKQGLLNISIFLNVIG